MFTKLAPSSQRGISLIELIVFIVIVSAATAGMLSMMSNVSLSSVDPLLRKQAMLRAESLLEEVALAHFTYCHPDDDNAESAASSAACAAALREDFGRQVASDTRPYFNINDYVSAANVDTAFNPADPSGYSVTDATGAIMLPAGYKTLVKITPVSGFGPAGLQIGAVGSPATPADADVVLITVTVAYNGGTVRLDRYRTRYAPNALP